MAQVSNNSRLTNEVQTALNNKLDPAEQAAVQRWLQLVQQRIDAAEREAKNLRNGRIR
jgi:hypothetical protein